MGKRVLVVSQYFYPENFIINDLAVELVNQGYHVDVLAGIPNYPEGVYTKGYGILKKRYEVYKGVNIYRVFQVPRGKKASNLRLGLNYLCYAFFGMLCILSKFAWRKKYNATIVFQLSPVTLAYPALLLKLLRKTKVITWILDIWPDSVTDNTTESQNRILLPILSAFTELVYKKSDKLLITSKGMEELVCRNGNYHHKIEYQPNWCFDFSIKEPKQTPTLPNGFILMMAGTLGVGIGVDDVIDLVKELSDIKDVHVVFVGSGSREEYLRDEFIKLGLTNAHLLGRFPYETMPSFYAKADAMLLTLQKTDRKHLNVTVPARLQSYMSSGKPVFAMIGEGASEVISRTNCGYAVPAGHARELSDRIKELYTNKEELNRMGKNSRKAFEQEFTIEKGIEHFKKLIENLNVI